MIFCLFCFLTLLPSPETGSVRGNIYIISVSVDPNWILGPLLRL